MAYIEIKGATPEYTIIFKDTNNVLIDPTTYVLIEIYLYNMASNNELIKFSTDVVDGFELIEPTSEEVKFIIPEEISINAESGENRIEIWTEDSNGIIDCDTAVFNEFIDSQNV